MTSIPNAIIIIPTLDKELGQSTMVNARATADYPTKGIVVWDEHERGFTATINEGLKDVLPDEYIVILNDDVYGFPYGWLRLLIETFSVDPTYGIVGPSGKCASSTQQGTIGGSGFVSVGMLPFWCVVVRPDVFEQLGLLDYELIHYSSDTWYCYLARNHGWKLIWNRYVYLWHTHKGSGFRRAWRTRDYETFSRKITSLREQR